MAQPRDCAVCGGRFTAQRSTAKYCSSRCRVRATRNGTAGKQPAAPPRREGAPLITLAPPAPEASAPPAAEQPSSTHLSSADGIVATTEAELRSAGRLDTSLGQAALYLAHVLANPMTGGQTGSSIASLIREHRATLAKAVEGAVKTETPLQRLRAARAARQIGA